MKFTLHNESLIAALVAVKAHTSTSKDDLRARSMDLTINTEGHLLVTASAGLTSGIARVRLVQDQWAGELGTLTIDRDDVAKIANMFGGKMAELEVTVTKTETPAENPSDRPGVVNTVKIRQLGQLFGGDQLTFTTPQQVRDISGIWHEVGAALRHRPAAISITRVESKRLGFFNAAARAYDEPLQLSVADGTGDLLVQCGPDFIGHLQGWAPSAKEAVADCRKQWAGELPMKLSVAKVGS